jgi:thiamine-phosphate pyrophosphorylase
MPARHPLPRLWLMTDERQGEDLWHALDRLPRGAGVVFRHCSLPRRDRLLLFERIRRIGIAKELVLLTAGTRLPGADGVHNSRATGLRSFAVHSLRELRTAERAGADLVFLSPVFATRSHPNGQQLGPLRFARLARRSSVPVIALGGMNAVNYRELRGAYGWAGIDAWSVA